MARLVANTAALPVEKTEMKMSALTREGRTGMPSRFIAVCQWRANGIRRRLTNDVWRFRGTRSSCCDRSKKVGIIRCGGNADTEGTSDVKKQDSIYGGVEGFWHDSSWRFYFASHQRNPIRSTNTIPSVVIHWGALTQSSTISGHRKHLSSLKQESHRQTGPVISKSESHTGPWRDCPLP